MKKIETIIRPEKLEPIKEGVSRLTRSRVLG